MDLTKVLLQLRAELENIDAAIASLERLQESAKKRPKAAELPEDTPRRPGRPPKKPRGSSSESP